MSYARSAGSGVQRGPTAEVTVGSTRMDEACRADHDLLDERLGPYLDEAPDHRLAAWVEVFEEDVGVVEGLQRGRRSPLFAGDIADDEAPERYGHAIRQLGWVDGDETKARLGR